MSYLKEYFVNCAKKQNKDTDFYQYGEDLFDSEDLTDAAYNALLFLITDGGCYSKETCKISDIGNLYLHGVYFPACERIALPGELCHDVPNMQQSYFCTAKERITKVNRYYGKLPKHTSFAVKGDTYKAVITEKENGKLTTDGAFVRIRNGKIYGETIKTIKINDHWGAQVALEAIAAVNDSQSLWVSTIHEDVGMSKTKVMIGMSQEQIKSLFYARSLPVTDTGRKRPILHLVRAHQRRLKEGIDIDISRHIRGVDKVSIDSLDFNIRPPLMAADLHKRWGGV